MDIAKAVEDGTKSKLAIMGRNTDGILKDFDDAVKAQRAKAKRGDDEDEDLIITQAGAGGVLLDGISFPTRSARCPGRNSRTSTSRWRTRRVRVRTRGDRGLHPQER